VNRDGQIVIVAEALMTLLEDVEIEVVGPEPRAHLRALLTQVRAGTGSADDLLVLVLNILALDRSLATLIPEEFGGDGASADSAREEPVVRIIGRDGVVFGIDVGVGIDIDIAGSIDSGGGGGGRSYRRWRRGGGSGFVENRESISIGRRARPAPPAPTRPAPVSAQSEPSLRKPPKARWLLSRVYDISNARPRILTRAFRSEGEHEIAVMIGPKQRGWLAAAGGSSVDDVVPAGAQKVTIAFVVPDQGVHMTQSLTLPVDGPSAECRFGLTAGLAGTRTKVVISLVHRGRALQTVELTGANVEEPTAKEIAERIAFDLAVVAPSLAGLEPRQRFDGSIQITRSDGVLVGFATTDRERSTMLPDLDAAVSGIRQKLGDLTDDSIGFGGDIGAPASVNFLRDLALTGGELYSAIGAPLEKLVAPDPVLRVQIVQVARDSFVPIEYIYDLPPPSNKAALCSNWRQALEEGHCEDHFHHLNETTEQLEEICPSGFWAVSKVIERQSVEQTAANQGAVAPAGPSPERARLGALNSALFAWSERLDAAAPGQSTSVLETLRAATRGSTSIAFSWDEWAKVVVGEHPPLLVLLSHTTDDIPARLEIGRDAGGETIALSQITGSHVRGSSRQQVRTDDPAPVVLLLGCGTAIADQAAYSFVAKFRTLGAAVVVGTLTSVLGEHVAPVTSALVKALSRAADETGANAHPQTFGEVWRRTRSRLLAEGQLAALCITAYGDADWFVGEPVKGS
jgi:hypothetical protein